MSFASSNRAAVRYIEEVTFGTTPANPAFQELRYTSEGINFNITNTTSNEIRSDRQTSDLVQTSADVSGDLSVEWSYSTYDDLIEGALGSAGWSTPVVEGPNSDVTIAEAGGNTTFTSAATADFSGFVAGQWVKVSGAGTATNNGYWQVVSATTLVLTLKGVAGDPEAAGSSITVTGSAYARNGTTLRSYTFQKLLQDSTTPTYFNFRGCRIGSMNMSFATGSILTGSFSVMGLNAEASTSAISGQSVVNATTTEVLNSVGNITQIWFDGAASTAEFANLTIDLNANLRAQDAIGTLGHIGIALGRVAVTGSIDIYFEDKTLYDKYVNATAFSLAFAIQDDAGNAYIVSLPNVKFSSATVVSGGLDQDVNLSAQYEAIMDGTLLYTIALDKFTA